MGNPNKSYGSLAISLSGHRSGATLARRRISQRFTHYERSKRRVSRIISGRVGQEKSNWGATWGQSASHRSSGNAEPLKSPSAGCFVGADLCFVLQRLGDIVQAVEQAMTPRRIDLESSLEAEFVLDGL